MEPNQAAGYLFEDEIIDLLENSGFVEVKQEKLRGRGTDHQIDAHGIYSIPVPFTYPIRLIAEAKCYEKSIELPLIRSFFGVVTDISENYFVKKGARELKDRFLDTGCFFAASPFTKPAQNFAWAHNIFLVSFSGIRLMDEILKRIRDFVNAPEIKAAGKIKKEDLIAKYHTWKTNKKNSNRIEQSEDPTIVFGIIDHVYPVILVGTAGWHKNIKIPPDTDKIPGIKISRKPRRGSVLFEIDISGKNDRMVTFFFTIPSGIAKRITGRIGESKPGEKIFDLDIPLFSWIKNQPVRRILTIEVTLSRERRHTNNRKVDRNDLKIKNENIIKTRWDLDYS